jgi:hypothetical protein
VCAATSPTPGAVTAPPAVNDPPKGGWTYLTYAGTGQPIDSFPFYYTLSFAETPNSTLAGAMYGVAAPPFAINENDQRLNFFDAPSDVCLPTGPLTPAQAAGLMTARAAHCGGPTSTSPIGSGSYLEYTTNLVGVNMTGTGGQTVYSFTWTDTFNGANGGINVPIISLAPAPSTGAGNIEVTSVNGVPVPRIVPSNQVSVQASGLAYSRVTRTFNGTVTITNISGTLLTTPTSFQLVLNSLPSGVTLANSMGTFNQCPYITIPALLSMAPGQSVTVAVEFSNPSNATINFTPEFYAGSFQ